MHILEHYTLYYMTHFMFFGAITICGYLLMASDNKFKFTCGFEPEVLKLKIT